MTLEETQRRTQVVSAIHDIVGALRTIAAGRIQGAQRSLLASRNYRDVVQEALVAAAGENPPSRLPHVSHRAPLLVVLTSEQPLCGAFNQNVLDFAERRWQELNRNRKPLLMGVGRRGLKLMSQRGISCDFSAPGATSLSGVRDAIRKVASVIDRLIAEHKVGSVYVVYNRYQSVSEQIPHEERILPIDLRAFPKSAGLPCPGPIHHYLTKPELLAGLVGEYSFISLYQAALDSFAGEQASRLTAMDGASRNTDRMLDELKELERRERQGLITAQVLEQIADRAALLSAKESSGECEET
ncbi:MAG: FoF1 ATP synthase subunit gamma [Planctomycetales bacterium]